MIRNELKELLPKGWESMFKHRDDWDPEDYSVGVFKLNESDKRETVLAKNDKTSDIMDYFFDDTPLSYQINLKKAIKFFTGLDKSEYILTKDYMISGGGFGKKFKKLNSNNISPDGYLRVTFLTTLIPFHRLVAYIFVPNPYPEKYTIVNHKNKVKNDFSKENLEWCDIKWNNLSDNKSETTSKKKYHRLSDNKLFSSKELEIEYSATSKKIRSSIYHSIKTGILYQNSKWEIIDSNLDDYLSRHPLTNVWHQHPVYLHIYADECGVLKVNGSLTVGCRRSDNRYVIRLNKKIYFLHRIAAECFTGKLIDDSLVVDHIIPTSNYDIDNSIDNLRVVTQKENMNNPITIKNLSKQIICYDLYGNELKIYNSRKDFSLDVGYIDKSYNFDIHSLVICNKYILVHEEKDIHDKLKYIYYKWKIDEAGNKICVSANKNLGPLKENYDRVADCNLPKKLRKYLNTGMPALDGFYYQQGNPKEMIYDPTNTKLEKKYSEIHWKGREIKIN